MNNKKTIAVLASSVIVGSVIYSCASHPPLETVSSVDLSRYTGTWYEIARFPNSFEKNLECVTATYSKMEDGKIKVVNKGHKMDDHSKTKTSEGKAKVVDKETQAKLKVTFFWPFSGDYWVIALDDQYQYAMVGEPSRKYLWILSRNKSMDEDTYNKLIKTAENKGFDTRKLVKVDQGCE